MSSQNTFGTNTCVANLTAGFIDLATYDELEKYMYGGPDATAYFVRETRKSTWFTQCPVTLAKCNGAPEFGAEWSCSISRAGDYLLGTWLHVVTPEVSLKCTASNNVCIAWTPNFMHALVKECCISFNDLVAARFDGTHLDFWAAFTTPASKAEGYKQMIGANLPTHGSYIPSYALNLPLPFFYTRDSGVALPTAALPYNEMRINFVFRSWQEMLLTFRETGNCPNGDYYGPAMAIEHPQTQTNQPDTPGRQVITFSGTITGPAAGNWVPGNVLTSVGGSDSGASGTIISVSDPTTLPPASGSTVTVQLNASSNQFGNGLVTDLRLNGANVTAGAPTPGYSSAGTGSTASGFTQVRQQEKVSRTNYAAPYFCKRNCPVVSAAADQLTIGGAINGFEVNNGGDTTGSNGVAKNLNVPNNHAIYRDGVALVANNPPTTAVGDVIKIGSTIQRWSQPASGDGTQASGSTLLATATIVGLVPNPLPNSVQPFTSNITNDITVNNIIENTPGNDIGGNGIFLVTNQQTGQTLVIAGSASPPNAILLSATTTTTPSSGPNNINEGNENQLGLFNDQYAHMNYDAEVCNKCLMMNGQDTGLFTQSLVKTPSLGANAVQVWANYAIVSNEERKRMACAPRDILIEQVQTTPAARFGGQTPFPLSSGGSIVAVKVLFFGAKNTTFKTVHSNYSTGVPCLSKENCGGCLSIQSLAGQGFGGRGGDQLLYALGLTNGPSTTEPQGVSVQNAGTNLSGGIHAVCDVVTVNTNVVGCCNAQDPMMNANLVYENTQRLGLMASDYYSQVQPYYHAPAIPSDKTSPVFCAKGYHMYSYSLDFICLDPLGSTNFGKLTNVAINATPATNWGSGACVSNESLEVLYATNGNNLPANFAAGSQGTQILPSSGTNKEAVLAEAAQQCAGSLKYTKADGSTLSFSIEELLLLNVQGNSSTSSTAATKVTGGFGLIDTNANTQKFSFQFVCTAVNNNIIRISGGALGFPVL
jgi:hypothetical protein